MACGEWRAPSSCRSCSSCAPCQKAAPQCACVCVVIPATQRLWWAGVVLVVSWLSARHHMCQFVLATRAVCPARRLKEEQVKRLQQYQADLAALQAELTAKRQQAATAEQLKQQLAAAEARWAAAGRRRGSGRGL